MPETGITRSATLSRSPNNALDGPDTTGFQKGHKANGLDYMLAYNVLWLESIQRNIKLSYFEDYPYDNKRDSDYSTFDNEELTVFFKYSGPVHKTEWRDGLQRAYPKNAIITGETVLVTGEQYFGDGHTLEILPDYKLTQCTLEQYLDD